MPAAAPVRATCSPAPARPTRSSPSSAPASRRSIPLEGRLAIEFLQSYSGQTTDQLLSLKSKYRLDSLVLAFESALNEKAARLGDGALSRVEQYIVAIEALEREVNNGGYSQYFGNEAFRPIVVEALTAIGCPRTAAVTARAIADPAREELLHKCDGEYYEAGEDIATLLFTHIEKNAGEVSIP